MNLQQAAQDVVRCFHNRHGYGNFERLIRAIERMEDFLPVHRFTNRTPENMIRGTVDIDLRLCLDLVESKGLLWSMHYFGNAEYKLAIYRQDSQVSIGKGSTLNKAVFLALKNAGIGQLIVAHQEPLITVQADSVLLLNPFNPMYISVGSVL